MIYFLATQNVTDVLVSVHTGEWCSRYRLSEDFVQMTVHFHWVTLQHTNSPIQEIQDNTAVDMTLSQEWLIAGGLLYSHVASVGCQEEWCIQCAHLACTIYIYLLYTV